MKKHPKPFIKGLQRGRNPQGKTYIEWFAIDYPRVSKSDDVNEVLNSYKEGFTIGEDDPEAEGKDENHFKAWVHSDMVKEARKENPELANELEKSLDNELKK
jgi:hypothetical protein